MLIEHHEGGGRPQRAGGEGEADQECEEKCEAPDGGECNQKGGDQKLEFKKQVDFLIRMCRSSPVT